MNTPTIASGAQFRICPLCEESRLVFSGLNEARCPACDCEPSGAFLKTLRQIVDLPKASEASRSRTEREIRARRPAPKNDEQKGSSPEDE